MRKHFIGMISTFIFLLACNSGGIKPQAIKSEEPTKDSIRILIKDMDHPWEILWGKDDHIWATERNGRISKIDPNTGKVVFFATLPGVVSNGEGGLLGMVQHPDFLNNGLFYVVYNYDGPDGLYLERMVQLKYDSASITPVKTLAENILAASFHNGSRLWITSDASPKLFMTTGDGSRQENAQNMNSLSGKVLRFNLDGTVPSDNPFPGSYIWSFGHRNQQGLVVANGIMYASEHGPSIEDELNIIEKKRNYGWPVVNGHCNQMVEEAFCNTHDVQEPIWSSGNGTLAVCGLDYYNNRLIPSWQNCLLMLNLKDASMRVLKLSADGRSVTGQQTFFKNRFGRLRDLCISPAGKVYICTSNGSNSDVLVEISKP
jgi:aldose sugar dehydrogenase